MTNGWFVYLIIGVLALCGCQRASQDKSVGSNSTSPATRPSPFNLDDVKRTLVAQIARKHGIALSSVVDVDASVVEEKDGIGQPYFHVWGSVATESEKPRNVYDALSQRLQANQCAVDPHGVCGAPMIKHIMYFDANARPATELDGASTFVIDEQVSLDRPLVKSGGALFRCHGSSGETVFTVSQRGYHDCKRLMKEASSQATGEDGGRLQSDSSSIQPERNQGQTRIGAAPDGHDRPPECPAGTMNLVKGAVPYPPQAIRLGHEGTVVLLLTFSRSGTPTAVPIEGSSGFRELDKAAQDAARNWRVTNPGCMRKETAVLRVPISFNLHSQ